MRTIRWFAVALALSIPAIGYLRYKPDDPVHAIDLALGDRAYGDAVKLLKAEIAKNPANEDLLLVKLAAAHELNKDFAQSIETLDRLLKKFPKSEWARKANFRKAQCFAALKQWDKAQALAGGQVRYLVSNERKLELADTYVKYAEAAFKPTDADKKPDYEKARVFYEKALDLGFTGARAEEIRYLIGLCHFQLGQFDQTVARLETFTKDFPQSRWAAPALYQLGLARARKGETVRARIHFRDLISDYPDTTQTALAAYEIAMTYGVPNPPNDESLELGVKALREFVAKYPDHARALTADFQIAQTYQNRGRADQAIVEYRRFIEAHAQSTDDLLPAAKIQLGHVLRGQKKFAEAIETWSAYLKAHPTHNQWDNVQREIISTHFMIADDLLRLKKHDEARKAYEDFLLHYPLDSRAPQAAYLLGDIDARLGQHEKAIAQWEKVVSKYAGQEYAKRARYRIALACEQNVNNLAKAYETYRKSAEDDKWPDGVRRFEELKKKHLAVVTERILRTDEKPVLRIAARNIEKLKFAAYRINMETYFNRHHSFRGIEKLDITLIEPVKRWEHTFADFEKYRLYEAHVEIPLEGPGVWAINATDEDLEATTMYVVSDLALISKSTRKEVFVFAQNTRTNKPYPNAQVLVSDGSKILAAGKTDEKGVFQQKIAELKTAPQAKFFVFDGSHYASNDLNIAQLAYVEELQPKAYIFTDKPAYRPGQVVHVAGIVRKVKDGQYEFEKGESFTCDLVGARGDLIERRTVALDDFGMFYSDFVLAAQAPLGEYKVNLYKEKGPNFTGSFRVERYQLENIELKIDLPQTVFLRGDKVKGKIIARYYYGEPVKDHPLVYEIPGFFIREARTSDTGEVLFEFDTREFVESQVLTLQARLPEDNVAQAKTLFIATRALNLAVATVRDVYLAGEKFDATVKATDLAGEKTTATATVRVIKLEVVDGKETEKEIAAHEVAFGKDKGEGRVAVQVADGGNYVIRAEGKDRFGTPVTAQKRVFVSGKEDQVMLRILGDRETFKVGETAAVNMVCRTTDTVLALVTYESDGILGYEIKELKKGENPHQFRMLDAYAPNMVLAAAAIYKNKFFTAEKDFTVNKGLTIEIKSEKDKYQPGETAKVLIKAFDQEGKPVRARMALALVDQALYALYGDTLPDIREFFYGGRRGRSVRTDTSATFRYAPATKPVVKEVREEQERLLSVRLSEERAATLPPPPAAPVRPVSDLKLNAPMGGFGGGAAAGRPDVNQVADAAGQQVAMFAFNGVAVETQQAEMADREGMRRRVAGRSEVAGRPVRGLGEREMPMTGVETISADRGDGLSRKSDDVPLERYRGADESAATQMRHAFVGDLGAFDADSDSRRLAADGAFGRYYAGYAVRDNTWYAWGEGRAIGAGEAAAAARSLFLELAYWNPRVTTDEKGEAVTTMPLPDNTTTWKIRARGTTPQTVVGDGSGSFIARRDFFVSMKVPAIVTEGNALRMSVSVHNLTDTDREVDLGVVTAVERKSDQPDASDATDKKSDARKLTVKARATETVLIERQITAGQSLRLEAEATEIQNPKSKIQNPLRDKVVRAIPIRPWGIEVRDAKGGKAHDSLNVTLELPAGRTYTNRAMEVSVGPVVEQALFNLPPMGFGGANTTLAARALANAALVEYLARTGERDTARYRTHLAELQALAGQIAASRREDGAWAFAGNAKERGAPDPFVSALSLRALARAKALGVAVSDDTMAKAIAQIENAYQKLAETENAKKADLLYALAFVGKADFTAGNR
ncbi:MAG: tetratricopeptide repeat protein, partial [Candidatus Sumerlaeia bacterium]|nr:tetratricopeptide repeat protein [Candidatus Sumerlaeia bacterium]